MQKLHSILVLVAFCLASVAALETTYPDMLAAGASGQFAIKIEVKNASAVPEWTAHNCTKAAIGAACSQPALQPKKDKIRFTFNLKDGIESVQTLNDMTPAKITISICFSKPSTTDRPWRKYSNSTTKNKSCPTDVYTWKWNATTAADLLTTEYSAVWTVGRDVPKATWYAQLTVKCTNPADGSTVVCAYDNTNTNSTANYVETTTVEQVTSGLTAGMIVGSVVGPTFLLGYFVVDKLRSRKSAPGV